MAYEEWSFLGAGIPHIALYDSAGTSLDGITEALRDAGNATALTLAVEVEEKSVPNKRGCGGGKINSTSRIISVTGSLTLTDFTAENLALAFLGHVEDVAAGAIVDEEHECWGPDLIAFDTLPDTTVAYVVTDDPGTTTYVKDTDYYETTSGIRPIAGGAMPTDGSTIKVDYTTHINQVVHAITSSSNKYRIFVEGLNEMQGCAPFNVDMFKVSFSPTSGLDLITEDPGALTLNFEILADPNQPSGDSQFFTMTKPAAA